MGLLNICVPVAVTNRDCGFALRQAMPKELPRIR
jgi:hypothetical protein